MAFVASSCRGRARSHRKSEPNHEGSCFVQLGGTGAPIIVQGAPARPAGREPVWPVLTGPEEPWKRTSGRDAGHGPAVPGRPPSVGPDV